jgi:uncharacterized protein (DUF924 family)
LTVKYRSGYKGLMHARAQAILEYWFGDLDVTSDYLKTRNPFWFWGGEKVDEEIRALFDHDLKKAVQGEYDAWADTPKGCLALTVLLDQFSLNLHREKPASYEQSALAIPIVKRAIDRGFDRILSPVERVFVYLPLEHSENLADQDYAVSLFQAMADQATGEYRPAMLGYLEYAIRHQRVVKRFGRFPDRNEVFGRENTSEEQAFLASDEAPF